MRFKRLDSGIITFDLDGVLVKLVEYFLMFHNEEFGTNLSTEDIHTYNLGKVIGISSKETKKRIYAFYHSPYLAQITAIDKAVESIGALVQEYGSERLAINTARPTWLAEATKKYNIHGNFPGAFLDSNIILTNQVAQEGPKKTKGQVCVEIGSSVMVEDNTNYAKECADKEVRVILLTRPWNENYPEQPGRIERADNWLQILEKIMR